MRHLGTRRAGLAAGAATVAVLALAGCSAGQVAETAILDTPIAGVDSQTADGSVLVRNVQVEYPGLEGYAAGASAPLELSLYNQTNESVTVSISSRPTEEAEVVSARQVGIVGGSAAPSGAPSGEPSALPPADNPAVEPEPGQAITPSESAGSSPSAPAAQVEPAQVKIGPQGSALFRPGDAAELQIIGLSEELKPGTSVSLVLEFSNGAPALEINAPVANPLVPISRMPGEPAEEHLGGTDQSEHE